MLHLFINFLAGKPAVAYDVAVNTKFFKKLEESLIYRGFVMQVVLEGIENKYDIELKKEGNFYGTA